MIYLWMEWMDAFDRSISALMSAAKTMRRLHWKLYSYMHIIILDNVCTVWEHMSSTIVDDDCAIRALWPGAASSNSGERICVIHTDGPSVVPFSVGVRLGVDDRRWERWPLGRHQTRPRKCIENAEQGELQPENNEQWTLRRYCKFTFI